MERLWRSAKYEHVYLYEYETVSELEFGHLVILTMGPTLASRIGLVCLIKWWQVILDGSIMTQYINFCARQIYSE